MEDIVVSDVCLDTAQARVTLRDLPDIPGVAADVFSAVAEGGVMVDMIVQNVSHSGRASLSFTVPRPDLEQCLLLAPRGHGELARRGLELRRGHGKALGGGDRPADAYGGRRKDVPGACRGGINVQLINTSEIRICAVVAGQRGPAALDRLNREFGR